MQFSSCNSLFCLLEENINNSIYKIDSVHYDMFHCIMIIYKVKFLPLLTIINVIITIIYMLLLILKGGQKGPVTGDWWLVYILFLFRKPRTDWAQRPGRRTLMIWEMSGQSSGLDRPLLETRTDQTWPDHDLLGWLLLTKPMYN